MKLLITFTLLTICLTACSGHKVDTLPTNDRKIDAGKKNPTCYCWNINDETKYSYHTASFVSLQNSEPRGGRTITDARGIMLGYRVYLTRVINESASPLELTITFPTDSFPLPWPDSYLKIFLLPDTIDLSDSMTSMEACLKSSYEAVLHKLPKLQETIKPKEAYCFHSVVLLHNNGLAGIPRGGFFLDENNLFYKIAPTFDTLVPCGKIVFKK